MEYIKIAKVDDISLYKRGQSVNGSLHLTTHHLIFTLPPPGPGETASGSRELWLCYPMIEKVEFKLGSSLLYLDLANNNAASSLVGTTNADSIDMQMIGPKRGSDTKQVQLYDGACLRIRCRDFTFLSFDFPDVKQCNDAFESIMKLTCLDSIDKVYAFIYTPLKIEQPFNGWEIYNPLEEFKRQQVKGWRLTRLNEDYKLCESYPSLLLVPSTISDNVLKYAAKYRSKARLPVLSYYYAKNGCTITRCAQPLVGLKQTRSIQDEKLVQEIFKSNGNQSGRNLIADARPLANAVAQTALGAGTENMDNYKSFCKKIFLGIDNIHVVRESLTKVSDVLKDGDISKQVFVAPNKELMIKSNWLKHISSILSGVDILIKTIHLNNDHLLIHCSDGWDRTSQLTSLVQLCIDPYFRTLEGFMVLVEKDWLSFGHRFSERSGFLQSETRFVNNSEYNSNSSNQAQQYISQVSLHFKQKKHLKYTSPVFHQFLDCVYQLITQNPNRFQFNERFLRRLLYHLYSCQYGTFLFDSEYERKKNDLQDRTKSVWDYFRARQHEFVNPLFDNSIDTIEDNVVIYPKISHIQWWFQAFQISPNINIPTAYTFAEGPRHTTNGIVSEKAEEQIGSLVEKEKAESEIEKEAQELSEDISRVKIENSYDDNEEELNMVDGMTDEDGKVVLDKARIDEMIKEAAKELSI